MKKVYIVSSGKYSDYHIDGVFDSRELAQTFIDSFSENSYSPMNIEEWNINPFERELQEGYKPYFVRISKDGMISDMEVSDSTYGYREGLEYGFDVNKNLYIHCFAKDNEQVVKIANDKRAELIASNEWKV